MAKTAVILFNLGGPDSRQSIRPFLFNFFMDRNIVALPLPFRWLLALYISIKRSKAEAGTSYGFLGDRSPLLKHSLEQAAALQKTLNSESDADYKCFVSMRYWHPMADEVAASVKDWNPDRIFLLPLYPQFSTTTTWSSLGVWNKACNKAAISAPQSMICCYPFNEGFIEASADNIRQIFLQAQKEGHASPRLLFSAHGLPESIIKKGDPYQWQCEQSAAKIAAALDIPDLDWAICYQSRVGAQKWIGPSTEEELQRAARDGKAVVIYPHAFTQEHVETLVEIEIEYREKAHELGVKGFYRVPAVSTHPEFIKGLAAILRSTPCQAGIFTEKLVPVCPEKFQRCCSRISPIE